MESVAVLTNELYCLLETTSQGRPTEHAITSAFQRYQIQRVPRVRKIHFLSGLITRLQAWDGILMRCMARWIVPLLIGDERIADQLSYLIKDSPKLDFVESMSRKGTIAWSDEKLRSDPEYRGSEAFDIRRLLALAAASALIMTCIYWRWGIVSSEGIT